MSKYRPSRPSAGLVVAVVALIMALGGTAYAGVTLGKNSVGTKQLKNGAVTSKKIKNGAVTGSKLNLTGVTVPNANHANTADLATNAGHANTANSANNAANATNATTAGNAIKANGRNVGCAAGTVQFLGQCFETSTRAPATVFAASDDCKSAGGYLGNGAQLRSGRADSPLTLDATGEWTDDIYVNGVTFTGMLIADNGGFSNVGTTTLHPYRCVFPLVGGPGSSSAASRATATESVQPNGSPS